MIGSDLLRYDTDQLYVVMDSETPGLNYLTYGYPWQWAWVVATKDRIISQHNHYVNWGFPLKISKGAQAVTGFDQRVIDRQGERPEDVYRALSAAIRNPNHRVLGHHLYGFDSMIEAFMAQELGYPRDFDYLDHVIDTNCIAKAIKKGFKPDRSSLAALHSWQWKMVDFRETGLKTSLGKLLDEYQIPTDKARLHKADYDVEQNMILWGKQMWEIEI